MAEVLSVYDPATKTVNGKMTLAPNNVPWAASDSVEQPHFYQESVTADTEFIGQFVPRPSVQIRAGMQYKDNNGPGLTGWSIQNASPTTNYLGYGGTHGYPTAAYEATGVWQRTMNLTAGEQALFTVHCNLHGCGNWNSTYTLFELDSSVSSDVVQYSPTSSSLSINMRGTTYSFTPTAFNAGTINATTLNGAISGANITSGTVPAARLPLFGASGSAHAIGAVPDPGATAGSTRFLREDGSWVAPSGGGAVSSVNGQTGTVVITPQSIGAQPNDAIVSGASADYTFSEGAGSALLDQSGSGNNATLASGGQAPAWLATGLAVLKRQPQRRLSARSAQRLADHLSRCLCESLRHLRPGKLNHISLPRHAHIDHDAEPRPQSDDCLVGSGRQLHHRRLRPFDLDRRD